MHFPMGKKQCFRMMRTSLGPTALLATPVAGHVVRIAGSVAGETVLDVGTLGQPQDTVAGVAAKRPAPTGA